MEAAGAPRDPSRAEADPRGKRPGTYSGRLLLRMPEALHGELARASERAGVSLNAFINDALAGVVGRGATQTPRVSPPAAGERTGRRRLLERLLVANMVVVAVVGVITIVLLVQALR
jgi:hypothetical protein